MNAKRARIYARESHRPLDEREGSDCSSPRYRVWSDSDTSASDEGAPARQAGPGNIRAESDGIGSDVADALSDVDDSDVVELPGVVWSEKRTNARVAIKQTRGREYCFPGDITQSRLKKAKLRLSRTALANDLAQNFGCCCSQPCPLNTVSLRIVEDLRFEIAKCDSEAHASEVITNMLIRCQKEFGFAIPVEPEGSFVKCCANAFVGILGVILYLLRVSNFIVLS